MSDTTSLHPSLAAFIAESRAIADSIDDPADCVIAIAPLMHRLVGSADEFLQPNHFRSEPDHYTRNAIHICPSGNFSLFALVWRPGQWTQVHDHGSWGVVGVVRGMLEERAYMAADGEITADSGIRLKRGGIVLLNPGAVSTFVPNPDHIHMTGVADNHETCVSLHLYGRNMDSFHIYDVAAGTRRMINVPHQDSD